MAEYLEPDRFRPRMDWPSIIAELKQKHVTQSEIAEHCGVSQATVSDLARGAQNGPSYAWGVKLIELHRSRVIDADAPNTTHGALTAEGAR